MKPLLLDVSSLPEEQCNDCLEGMFKALAENPEGDPRSIWTPHDNPFLTAHVEDVTQRLSAILLRIQEAFSRALLGEPLVELAKAEVPWLRWDPGRFEQVRIELEAKGVANFTLDDWMLLADFLIQRYLPDGVISSEAEYLTVRAAILGKLQATAPAPVPPDVMAAWTTLAPTYFAKIPPRALEPLELEVMQYARTRAALHISHVTEDARARMKTLVLEHVQAQMLGQKEGRHTILKTRLFDEFGQLNRDFRRIAITEAGEACNQGFVASRPLGSRVKRIEAYRGACKFCKSINGMVFEVVAADYPDKDGATQIWPGKSNVGRSASPNKRVGSILMERGPTERWWPAAGVQHPLCRGAWLPIQDTPPDVRPEFMTMMRGMIAQHRALHDPAPKKGDED